MASESVPTVRRRFRGWPQRGQPGLGQNGWQRSLVESGGWRWNFQRLKVRRKLLREGGRSHRCRCPEWGSRRALISWWAYLGLGLPHQVLLPAGSPQRPSRTREHTGSGPHAKLVALPVSQGMWRKTGHQQGPGVLPPSRSLVLCSQRTLWPSEQVEGAPSCLPS